MAGASLLFVDGIIVSKGDGGLWVCDGGPETLSLASFYFLKYEHTTQVGVIRSGGVSSRFIDSEVLMDRSSTYDPGILFSMCSNGGADDIVVESCDGFLYDVNEWVKPLTWT